MHPLNPSKVGPVTVLAAVVFINTIKSKTAAGNIPTLRPKAVKLTLNLDVWMINFHSIVCNRIKGSQYKSKVPMLGLCSQIIIKFAIIQCIFYISKNRSILPVYVSFVIGNSKTFCLQNQQIRTTKQYLPRDESIPRRSV